MAESIEISKAWYRSIGLLGLGDPPMDRPAEDVPAPPVEPPEDAFVDVPTVSIANNRNSQK